MPGGGRKVWTRSASACTGASAIIVHHVASVLVVEPDMIATSRSTLPSVTMSPR